MMKLRISELSITGDVLVMKGGLTDEQCSTFNKEILKYILDNLMPWNKENGLHYFSLNSGSKSVSFSRICAAFSINVYFVYSET